MKRAPSASIEEYIVQDWCFEEGGDDDAIEMATVIRRWALPGNWLDLGCGPMLTVWPMFSSGETAIWGCDRHPTIATFHKELKLRPLAKWPIGLKNAVAFYNRNFAKLNGVSRISTPLYEIQGIITGNLLEAQRPWFSFFRTVLQISCFGCLDSVEDLKRALDLVSRYLQAGGRFISATWLPRASYLESEVWGGIKLPTLTADVFCSLVHSAGLAIREVREKSLEDPDYHTRYIVVAENTLAE